MVLSMQILLLEDHQYTIDLDAIDTKLISFVLVMLAFSLPTFLPWNKRTISSAGLRRISNSNGNENTRRVLKAEEETGFVNLM